MGFRVRGIVGEGSERAAVRLICSEWQGRAQCGVRGVVEGRGSGVGCGGVCAGGSGVMEVVRGQHRTQVVHEVDGGA